MVFVVEPDEEDVVELLEWGEYAGFAYLYNRLWPLSSVVGFRPIKPSEKKRLYMDMDTEFAADAAGVVYYTYFYHYTFPPFSLKIKNSRDSESYYEYNSWCGYLIYLSSGESLDNICVPANNYVSGTLPHGSRELSLEPPLSLRTIVPTQLSSLI